MQLALQQVATADTVVRRQNSRDYERLLTTLQLSHVLMHTHAGNALLHYLESSWTSFTMQAAEML